MFAIHETMMEAMTGFAPEGHVESGELVLRETSAGRVLSTSMFSRWTPGHA
jgi:23S rRNA (cytosine1962-C5)-methyltransferase